MAAATWVLDPSHSEVTFRVRHMMISNVRGEFTKFDALIDGADFTKSTITATIDLNSLTTNDADRDTHLKSADFFEVEKYPEIKFVSTSMEKVNDDEFKLNGNLSIRGITKEVTLNVEFGGFMKDPSGNEKAGFSVDGRINRKDFGLNWNAVLEAGGVMVGDEVRISADVQFTRKS